MGRLVGTISRGLRAPIIHSGKKKISSICRE